MHGCLFDGAPKVMGEGAHVLRRWLQFGGEYMRCSEITYTPVQLKRSLTPFSQASLRAGFVVFSHES